MEHSKKILILYTSHTLGHKSIAENIGYYLEQAGYIVVLRDALEIERPAQVAGFLKLHTWVNKHAPFIWRWLYKWGYTLTLPLWELTARLHSKKIYQVIQAENPDVTITTQVSPTHVVSYLKRKGLYTGQFGIAFSDFHFHPTWMRSNADFYFVNIEEQKYELTKRGVREQLIFVCGITAKPKVQVDPTQIKQKFQIPPQSQVVLVGSGSLGVGLSHEVIHILSQEVHPAFRAESKELHTIIVCGRNEHLYHKLRTEIKDPSMHVLGFYAPMDELYAISNLYISKPGGLSVIESLRWHLPMFVTHMLPGQEELNAQYLEQKALIDPLCVKPVFTWAKSIMEELKAGLFRASLIHNPASVELVKASDGTWVKQGLAQVFHGQDRSK